MNACKKANSKKGCYLCKKNVFRSYDTVNINSSIFTWLQELFTLKGCSGRHGHIGQSFSLLLHCHAIYWGHNELMSKTCNRLQVAVTLCFLCVVCSSSNFKKAFPLLLFFFARRAATWRESGFCHDSISRGAERGSTFVILLLLRQLSRDKTQ